MNAATTTFVKEWLQKGVKLASVSAVPFDDHGEKTKTSQQSPQRQAQKTKNSPRQKGSNL